jgi:predicted metalloprotease with PDZ domain
MVKLLSLVLFLIFPGFIRAQQPVIRYSVSMPEPSEHYFEVELAYTHPGDTLILKMPVWSPGGYFITDFAAQLQNFSATDQQGKQLAWSRSGNSWSVLSKGSTELLVRYRIKGMRPGIDTPWVEDSWAMIGPTGMFLYADKALKLPVTLTVNPLPQWNVPHATGLTAAGKPNTFLAEDFDILYDSPVLMGNLETLEPVYINSIPHYFTGRDLGKTDRKLLMMNLGKIMEEGIAVFDDIPYKDYKYLSIGPGPGGIEHLNSTVVSFRSDDFLSTPETRFRNYKLLAHEYFHHYNVKRVRPVELGPFDYSGPNYTRLLWFAEGVTEYYAHLMLLRSGLATDKEALRSFQHIIRNYENKPGHLYQSLEEASLTVWDNSPFSKTKKQAERTISYYEKGCILGLLLDFDIRHRSGNKHSLDDVMSFLYKNYYQEQKRGFTDAELKAACESFAGSSMDEVFSYASTTKAVDYPKYFSYAGLEVDTTTKAVAYLGFTTGVQMRNYMTLNSVEENGPAWNAGLHTGDILLKAEGREPSIEVLNNLILEKKPGDKLTFEIKQGEQIRQVVITTGSIREKTFSISKSKTSGKLQKQIYNSWQKSTVK